MLVDRMLRAARLEVGLYEEVERDTDATSQALLVVVIVALATGIGAGIGHYRGFGAGLAGGVLEALLGWLVWSLLTYWVGTAVFGGTATPGELLRTIGFAQAPGVLNILGFIPICGGLIRLGVVVWMLIAGLIAVRQALDFSMGKAVGTVIVGWLGMLVVFGVLRLLGLGFLARF